MESPSSRLSPAPFLNVCSCMSPVHSCLSQAQGPTVPVLILPMGSVTGLKFSSLDFITYASTLRRRGGAGEWVAAGGEAVRRAGRGERVVDIVGGVC